MEQVDTNKYFELPVIETRYGEAPDGVCDSYNLRVRKCKRCGDSIPDTPVKLTYHTLYNCK